MLVIALALYVFMDYRQHRKPLKVAVTDARYGVVHHVRKVLLPIIRRKWKVITYALTLGIASFAVIGLTFIIGIQRFAEAKNFDITIAGSGANGFVAFTPRPTLRGTAAPNSVLSVSIDNQVVGTTNVNALGQWAYQPSAGLSLGNHEVKVETFESGKYIYIGDGAGLSVYNAMERRVTGNIPLPAQLIDPGNSVGNNSLSIATQPLAQKTYAISGINNNQISRYSSGYITIVDNANGTVIKSLPLSFRPFAIQANSSGQQVTVVGQTYDNGVVISTVVVVIDVDSDTIVGSPASIAANQPLDFRRIETMGRYSTDNQSYLIRNSATIYKVSMADGSSDEIDLSAYIGIGLDDAASRQVIPTSDPDIVYTLTSDHILKINLDTMQVVDDIDYVGKFFDASTVIIKDDDSTMWFVGSSQNDYFTLWGIDLVNKQVVVSKDLEDASNVGFSHTYDLAVNSSGTRAYILRQANYNDATEITVVDLGSDQFLDPVSLGTGDKQVSWRLLTLPGIPNTAYFVENYISPSGGGGALRSLNLNNGSTIEISNNKIVDMGVGMISGDPILMYSVNRQDGDVSNPYFTYDSADDSTHAMAVPFNVDLALYISSKISTDSQSSTATKTAQFTVASVSITDPLPQAVVNGTSYTVHGQALAGFEVEILVDGESIGAVTTGQDDTWTAEISGLVPGQTNIEARARSDSYGIPIMYIGDNFGVSGFQFFDIGRNQVEVHDDVDFGGKLPLMTAPDGNTAFTMDYLDLATTGTPRIFKYDLISKQEEGSVLLPGSYQNDFLQKGMFSADNKTLFVFDAHDSMTYLAINVDTLEYEQHAIGPNSSELNLRDPNQFVQSPDRSKIYIAGKEEEKVYVLNTATLAVSTIDTGSYVATIGAPNNDYVVVFNGYTVGDFPNNYNEYVNRYNIFSSVDGQLLGGASFGDEQHQSIDVVAPVGLNKIFFIPRSVTTSMGAVRTIDTTNWTGTAATIQDQVYYETGQMNLSSDGTKLIWITNDDNLIHRLDTDTGQNLSSIELPNVTEAIYPVPGHPELFGFRLVDNKFGIYNSDTNTVGDIIETGLNGFAGTDLFSNESLSSYTGFVSAGSSVNLVVSDPNDPTPDPDPEPTTPPVTPTNPTAPTTPPKTTPTRTSTTRRTTTPTLTGPVIPDQVTPATPNAIPLTPQVAAPQQNLPDAVEQQQPSRIPKPIALAISWLLLIILLVIAMMYAWRAKKEYDVRQRLERSVARLQGAKQAVDTYLAVTTHYLNTPVAIMGGALELLVSQQKLPDWAVGRLQSSLKKYGADVAKLSQESQTATAASPTFIDEHARVTAIDMVQSSKGSPLKQRAVYIPIAVVGAIFAIVTVLFARADIYSLGSVQVLLQALCFVLSSALIVTMHRNRDVQRAAQAVAQQTYATEERLVKGRTEFIVQADATLTEHYENLNIITKDLHIIPETRMFFNGLSMFGATVGSIDKVAKLTQLSNDPPAIDLGQEIPRAISDLQTKAKEKQIQIQFDIPASLTHHIQPEELRQLVYSLTQNAVAFSGQDAQGGKILIAAKRAGKSLVLSVHDTGVGIADDKLGHLFEPFYRATDTEAFDYQGLGLNLYINKLIVEKLGGTIQIKSSTAKGSSGTEVTVKLPVQASDTERTAPVLVTPMTYGATGV